MKLRDLFDEGDLVTIISTHKDDLHKAGRILIKHPSYAEILILNPDGTPERNSQNNEVVIYNHTYVQFKKANQL